MVCFLVLLQQSRLGNICDVHQSARALKPQTAEVSNIDDRDFYDALMEHCGSHETQTLFSNKVNSLHTLLSPQGIFPGLSDAHKHVSVTVDKL